MAVTVTTIAGPFNMGPKFKIAVYQCALDAAHASGGEAIDISGDFDFLYAAWAAGVDAAADVLAAKYDVIVPAPTTAVSSTNVLITATTEAFAEETGDLSAVGQLTIVAIGS